LIFLIIGRRDQGKTTLAYHMAHKAPTRLVFDPRMMIDRPSALRVRDTAMLTAAVDEAFFDHEDEIVFSPEDDDLQAAFDAFAREVKRWCLDTPARRQLAVVVDEAAFVDLRSGPFQWVIRCCPRSLVNVFVTAHRPADIAVIVRGLADHWLIFPTTQEHDLDVIRERCSPATADAVVKLNDREFAHWDDTRATLRVNRRPDSWYIPLKGRRQHVGRSHSD
jgi:hypothetical protein